MVPAQPPALTSHARVGVYAENLYRRRGDRIATIHEAYAFMLFVTALRPHVSSLVVFGRQAPPEVAADFVLPAGIDLVELPFYPSLRSGLRLARALRDTVRTAWNAIAFVDVLWVFGPHPVGLLVVALGRLRGKLVVLAVRQDTLRYFRSRMPNDRWLPLLGGPLWLLDALWRLLGRRLPVAAVGEELARQYGWPRRDVLPFTVTLVREADVADGPARTDYDGPIRLLAVGRIDREKDPLAVVEAVARLGPRYSLTWVGSGPLEDEVGDRARALGAAVELRGFVPFGDGLRALYRSAHVFVHASLTEGAPGAVVEALAFGVPVVATAVGGVPALLAEGRAGLLVPPRDPSALAAAVERVVGDPELRERLVAEALAAAAGRTLEREVERIAEFLAARVPAAQ